jgi:hypothetical protein
MKTQLIKALIILVGLSLASCLESIAQGSTKINKSLTGSQDLSLSVLIFGGGLLIYFTLKQLTKEGKEVRRPRPYANHFHQRRIIKKTA